MYVKRCGVKKNKTLGELTKSQQVTGFSELEHFLYSIVHVWSKLRTLDISIQPGICVIKWLRMKIIGHK